MCASHAAHSGTSTSTGWVHRPAQRIDATQPVQRLRAGLAVEVAHGLDQADPGRDFGIRPGAEFLPDRLDDGFGLVVLALAGQVDAALRAQAGGLDRVTRRGDARGQLGQQA